MWRKLPICPWKKPISSLGGKSSSRLSDVSCDSSSSNSFELDESSEDFTTTSFCSLVIVDAVAATAAIKVEDEAGETEFSDGRHAGSSPPVDLPSLRKDSPTSEFQMRRK